MTPTMRRPRGNLKAVWSEQGPAREYDTRTYESGEHATLARLPGALVEERRQLVEEEESSGRYDFTALLGEGGMGEVRLCMDRRIQRAIALKNMRPELADRRMDRVRFVEEALVQAQLEHPSIVPVYDLASEPNGAPYFTMRRVEGLTLDAIIRQTAVSGGAGEYSRHRLLTAFGNVCLALDYAHSRGVYHCDVKPANIMLGSFGEVYLLDWGLAERVGARGRGGGTPGYMAPEQVRGETLDARTDVYALGATLFELLTLTSLHPVNLIDAAKSTIAGTRIRPSERAPDRGIAPELDAICLRATAPRPADRFGSVRELYDALDRYLAGDRDLSLRREMSQNHVTAARLAYSRAKHGGPEAMSARSESLRAVGRALAFDPENQEALRALVELLTHAPSEMPADAVAEDAAAERQLQRARARAGAVGCFAWVALLPAFYIGGVSSIWALLANAIAWTLPGVALLRVAARPQRDGFSPAYVPLLAAIAVAMTSLVLGPGALTATFATVISLGFTLAMAPKHRYLPFIACSAAVVVPWLLASAGVLPMAEVQSDVVLKLRIVAELVCIFIATFFALRLRDKLTSVRRRVFVHSWQLRQLLPRDAAPPVATTTHPPVTKKSK